jgi:hypothetical protein
VLELQVCITTPGLTQCFEKMEVCWETQCIFLFLFQTSYLQYKGWGKEPEEGGIIKKKNRFQSRVAGLVGKNGMCLSPG